MRWLLVLALLPCACSSVAERDSAPLVDSRDCGAGISCAGVAGTDAAADAANAAASLAVAHTWSHRASVLGEGRPALNAWAQCAIAAYPALGAGKTVIEAATLSVQCTDALLDQVLAQRRDGWLPGTRHFDGIDLDIEFRQLSPYLQGPLTLTLARDVPMTLYGDGGRMQRPGFGVPLAVLSARCDDRPLCKLLPPEGVFRNATAWIEPGRDAGDGQRTPPRLVIADAVALDTLTVGTQRLALAYDTSAGFASGAGTSRLDRLAIWGLLGGHEVGRLAGLYLLEDYDPRKQPLVMIHGLGSSPLTWARLSNAVWGAPELRERFQVWHVVYQTNAPLLVTRRRVQRYLDEAWSILDPEGDDEARSGVVLVGHSMGGVVARLLCIDSGEVLWNAAFVAPISTLTADPADLKSVDEVFHFKPYPGISRAIFIASPHGGSPSATRWFGRLARVLVGRRTPELESLKRISEANPEAVQPELRLFYQQARLNSISTLQTQQPVRVAGQALMPAAGIRYHTIAGALPGRSPQTDGVVPLSSAVIPGAESTLVLPAGHDVHESAAGVAEVLRILRASIDADDLEGKQGVAPQQ
ncbi:MAG TPA: alpha/beta hydrolase [Lysobacter sp.]